PLFGATEERVLGRAPRKLTSNGTAPHAETYYQVVARDVGDLPKLREQLAASALVSACYLKPGVSPPMRPLRSVGPTANCHHTSTPDFSPMQGYLGDAPEGIDAHYAWNLPG